MDNSLLEMFAKLFNNNQNNNSNSGQNLSQNPAFSSYPSEAYSQTQGFSNGSHSEQSQNNDIHYSEQSKFNENSQANQNTQNDNPFSSINNLFSGQNQNLLPMLLSLLGKNSNLSSLSQIFSQSSNKDDGNKKEKISSPKDELIL